MFVLKVAVADVIPLNSDNINTILNSNELVMVNFYADWCRFSQMLTPIFEEAERKVKEKHPDEGKVVFAKVDCDRESQIAGLYQVSKYPTLKLFQQGQVMKREYRGQRSVDAFVNFISDQLQNPIQVATDPDELDNLDWHKPHVIGYFDSEDSPDYKFFQKVASILRSDCNFHSLSGPLSEKDRIAGNKIVFRPAVENYNEMVFPGMASDYNMLLKWTTDKCVPLVREITFENAEELTEEGLPFMILFHHPDDIDTPQRFRKHVASELLPERNFMNFLVADGLKFTHPLHHLGKSANDLPIIAIDSFKHMYLWNKNVKEHMEDKGALLTFIQDLKSGKLHREFHNGPDPTQAPELPVAGSNDDPSSETDSSSQAPSEHIPHDPTSVETKKPEHVPGQTSPPESLFKKLAPSKNRYTILRDEL
ncbi:hypothetical protein HELRODRAFT_106306 [Helobdella robusta]|uniref:Thioredoxin domain-containing protein n=1 Tax=Helobdella robusta TaxID=6412 RepID=T1EE17_HELRO|nr:hypothetical protein HELRODRAFT_106306 [Helobdella robusta]ESO06710.1 hypothetical protein HELRODRAFT_106306 [Helobdella robusta]